MVTQYLLDVRVMSFGCGVTFPQETRSVSGETRDLGSACIVEGRERVQCAMERVLSSRTFRSGRVAKMTT